MLIGSESGNFFSHHEHLLMGEAEGVCSFYLSIISPSLFLLFSDIKLGNQ